MKIIEIVSEQRTDEILGYALKGLGAVGRAAWSGAKASPQSATQAAAQTGKIVKNVSKEADKILKSKGLNKSNLVGKSEKSRIMREINRGNAKIVDAQKAQAMQAANAVKERWADYGFGFISWTAISYAIVDYYFARSMLDPQSPTYNDDLNQLNGRLMTSIIAPRIAGSLAKLTGNGIAKIVGVLGKPANAGSRAAEVTRFWTSLVAKAGQTGLTVYFQTPAGKEFLEKYAAWAIAGLGAVSEILDSLFVLVRAVGNVAVDYATDISKGNDPSQKSDGRIDPYAGTSRAGGI
jgi:ElaB/YqjD/DUF883 family membrane-anchored ribosome-binding protein